MSTTTTLGIVDSFEGEHVETEFSTLLGVVPLGPVASYYRRSADQRYPIALSSRSVLQAVLSHHLLYATVLAAGLGMANLPGPTGELLLMVAVICGLLCGFGRLRVGRPTASEQRRRGVHLEITGVSGLPHMLPRELSTTLREALERKWSRRGGEGDWRAACDAQQVPPALAKLVAVLAALDAELEPAPAATARCEAAWKACEAQLSEAPRSGEQPLESLSPEEALKVLRSPAAAPAQGGRKTRGIKIRCERCDHVTRVPTRCAGQVGRCPSCQKGVRVPSKESIRMLAA